MLRSRAKQSGARGGKPGWRGCFATVFLKGCRASIAAFPTGFFVPAQSPRVACFTRSKMNVREERRGFVWPFVLAAHRGAVLFQF